MKRILAVMGLAGGVAAQLFAGETLHVKLQPDRDYLLSGSPQEVVLKLDLKAIADKRHLKRAPLNLAVVLDRSGSMTGAKIEQARQAATLLVDRLSPDDMFSLVTYSDSTRVMIPAQRVKHREELKERISSIRPGGSTALYAGVKTGSEQLREYISSKRINRVILLSDGLANVGPSSTHALRRLGRELSHEGIAVTTIGLGADYNEDLMAGLAEASDANYYYVQDTEKLPSIFAKELGELIHVCARKIRIHVTCPDGIKPIEFIGRPEKFHGQEGTLELSYLTSGQKRSLFLRCVANAEHTEIAHVKVSYVDEISGGDEETTSGVAKVRFTTDDKRAASSANASVMAEKELLLTAIAKDEALADADAGNYQAAASKLKAQAVALHQQYENAPARVQAQIRQETSNLRSYSDQIEAGRYDSATRKTLQWQSWNARNSK